MKQLKTAFLLIIFVAFSSLVCAQDILITYYSRTGDAKIVAEELWAKLPCAIQEIRTEHERIGPNVFLCLLDQYLPGWDADIEPVKRDPKDYKALIICSPIWLQKLAGPTRTFLKNADLKGKEVYVFITMAAHFGAEDGVKKLIASRGGHLKGVYKVKTGGRTKEEIAKQTIDYLNKIPELKERIIKIGPV